MTIQAIIYNKGSMILCTDLRQTVEEFKSYVGVKKIFKLKKSEPVGIMFNGLMDFEGVPIETLIGEFKEKFIEFASGELEKIGIIKKENIIDSFTTKVKKAYPAYFGTYKDFNKVRNYLDSINNLYCIGRNGQHRYNNMDHSMLTGIEACKAIIKNSPDKSDIWNVNTEKEYHEEKGE